ncbi:GlxA family transcriptional regulator [Pseudofrankia asymbiotica]|uniref:AraC family transcriptional regulator n=1 Tax=Pseudofrankia asymbiotica TaxID=1834516 RepID=A0A1V2HZR7_9ACTN|nr:helix-turn-helix domain-containing protein [Pseudofrankia asymbiotica]ONH22391.1 AraC family transcriptional regulator [Pseudofrankia asymbiotica]
MQLNRHRVGVLAIPPVTVFDFAIPELVFSAVEVDGAPAYDVVAGAAEPGVLASTGSVSLVVEHGLDALRAADTLIVTGSGRREGFDPRVLDVLRDAAREGRRIASICTGAFALASAGLLDGRTATTYWPYTDEFARRFPRVNVQPGVLYTDDGDVLTSAGVAAGLDLCLHLIRLDHGAASANQVARLVVMAPVRHGGQQQFIDSPLPPARGTTLAGTRSWALERLEEELALRDLAAHAHTSVRNLTRRFQAETGLSPLQWLLHQRIDRARVLLETTTLPMDQISRRSGLGSAESLRQHFIRRVGVPPSTYRASFAGPSSPPASRRTASP